MPLSLEKIDKAVDNLYDGRDGFPPDPKPFIKNAFKTGDFENIYLSVKKEESEPKELLVDFEKDYPKLQKNQP